MTPAEVAKAWNQGNDHKPCRSGINDKGVKFDSCAYVAVVMNHYKSI